MWFLFAAFSEIYCTGSLLRAVQMAKLYPDSKTFVDMSIREGNTPLSVLEAFSGLNNPSKEVLKDFVTTYFEEGTRVSEQAQTFMGT